MLQKFTSCTTNLSNLQATSDAKHRRALDDKKALLQNPQTWRLSRAGFLRLLAEPERLKPKVREAFGRV